MIIKKMKQYDLGTDLRGQILSENNGQPMDLTNATVKFVMRQINDDGTTTELVNSDAVIESPPTDGSFRYEWIDGDTDVAGTHIGSFKFVFHDDNNRLETYPKQGWIYVSIEPDLSNV